VHWSTCRLRQLHPPKLLLLLLLLLQLLPLCYNAVAKCSIYI
jgi:hypothetical protein